MPVTTSTAPELTAEQVQRILVRPLEAASIFLAAGPRVFDTAGGNQVRIPKLGGPITDPGFTGEAEAIPEREVTFGEVVLLPSTMESLKVIVRFSSELARQSIVSLDAAIRDRLVTDVAARIDAQLLSASGDGITTPRGLFAHAGTQTVAVDGPLDFDALLEAWGKALSANVNMANLRWLLTPRDFVTLRGLKSTDGKYLMQPDPTLDSVFRIFGSPVLVSPRIPDTTAATPTGRAALVDFSQIAVARDLVPAAVKLLDQTYAATDELALRVVLRLDAAPLNPEAIVKLTGITI